MSKEIIKINNNAEIKVTRHESGEVRCKTSYVNGLKHGLDICWWDNGKKHGMDSAWRKNGKKEWEKIWADGRRHGVTTYWHDSSEKEKEKEKKYVTYPTKNTTA